MDSDDEESDNAEEENVPDAPEADVDIEVDAPRKFGSDSIEIDPERVRKYDRISQKGNNQKALTEFDTKIFFTIEDALKDILNKMYDFQVWL